MPGDLVCPIVYKITNKHNNKCYIGWTSCTLEGRWNQHIKLALKNTDNRKFYNAIRKYGIDCWDKEILLIVKTKSEAKKKEIELIELFDTYHNGYNSTKGGDGNNGIIMSAESNLKRSIALRGIPKNYDRMKGKNHSAETKEKISKAHQGKLKPWVKWTNEQIMRRANTRRMIVKEQYIKIKELQKNGLTIKNIANAVGLSIAMVKKWKNMEWPE